RDDRVPDAKHALTENVGAEAGAVRQALYDTGLRQAFEMTAGLGEPDALHSHRTHLKDLPDEIVQRHALRDEVAPGLGRLERDAVLALQQIEHFAGDKGHLPPAAGVLREAAFAAEIAIALEDFARYRTHLGHRFESSLGIAADLDGDEVTVRQPRTSPTPRSCSRRPDSARARARAWSRAGR